MELAHNETVFDIPLPIIAHPHLDELLTTIRHEPIPWKEYQRMNLITLEELAMIEHVENKSPKEISSTMSEHGIHYAHLYLELMRKLARVDAVQKVLVLIHDMLKEHDERIELFHRASQGKTDSLFEPFHRALNINDEWVAIQSSRLLTLLICSSAEEHALVYDFFRWITFQLQSRQMAIVELNVQMLSGLFHVPSYRLVFWNTPHAVDSFLHVLMKKTVTPQRLYEGLFSLWLLTFEKQVCVHLNKKYDVIPTLMEIAKYAIKEKIIRMVIAIFKNCIQLAPRSNLSAMLVAKVLPFTEHLSTRKWSDQEIVQDIQMIKEALEINFQSLTTLEVYASEVETGKLEWSPPHTSENFWSENAIQLEKDQQRLLKMLTRLLSSKSPTVLAIACHDLGQYVKYRSKDGRLNIEKSGAKQRILELMTHEDSDVRYNALSAIQKYFAMV
ncbi:armadillo-type protein [Spinellus fusiger]|nr:armadillo-type protein [Spinellus fusiger]